MLDKAILALALACALGLAVVAKIAYVGRRRTNAAEQENAKLRLEVDEKRRAENGQSHKLESTTRLGRILDDTANEIYVYDVELLRFVQVNRGARNNLGYEMNELKDLTAFALKSEIAEGAFLEMILPLRADSQRCCVFETVHRRKDGSTYPVEVRLQLSRSESPPVFVEIVQDITERRDRECEQDAYREHLEHQVAVRSAELIEINGRLELAAQQAKVASETKSEFLANMSHELRTPLNAIIGITEMLIEDAEVENSESLDPLNRVHRAGDHLLVLIDDILDLSQIEAGRMTLNPERFSVCDVLAEVMGTAQPLANSNNNRLVLDAPGDLGEMVADPLRLKQIILNLASNACKFTRGGEVRVSARRRPAAKGGDELCFAVSDTGIGILDCQMQRLFTAFTQVDSSTTRKFGGTGLGLAICRELSGMMGGTVHAESERGKGSTFSLRLPVGPRICETAGPAGPSRKKVEPSVQPADFRNSEVSAGSASTS